MPEVVVQILNFGVMGLGFLLASQAFRLLSNEQHKPLQDRSFKAIAGFMVFSFALCALGLASEGLRLGIGRTSLPPDSVFKILTSASTGPKARADFFNSTASDVKLYRVDEQGALRTYGNIGINDHHELDSVVGHRWLVTDAADRPIGLYAITSSSMSVVITDQASSGSKTETYVVLSSDDENGASDPRHSIRLKRQDNLISGDGDYTNKKGEKRSWVYSGYWNNGRLVLAYRSSKPEGIGYGVYFLEQISGAGNLYKGHWEGNSCAKPGTEPPQRIMRCNAVLVRGKPDDPEVGQTMVNFNEYLKPQGCIIVRPAPERNCPLITAISK
jgi:hypothetical protein